MQPAHYSVIRYMPDPGRGERLNIGVLLWTPHRHQFRIDEAAIERVLRENPKLEKESLYYVLPTIRDRLVSGEGSVEERVAALLANQRAFPVDLTEARFTAVADYSDETVDEAVDALVNRIVKPRRTGRTSIDARRRLEQALKPLLRAGRVEPNHVFPKSLTGVPRAVDFYANSHVNTALDVLRLNVKKADDIRSRADAQAFKAYDVQQANAEIRFVVYCDLSNDRSLASVNDAAQTVIESTGARVVTDQDAAERAMKANDRA